MISIEEAGASLIPPQRRPSPQETPSRTGAKRRATSSFTLATRRVRAKTISLFTQLCRISLAVGNRQKHSPHGLRHAKHLCPTEKRDCLLPSWAKRAVAKRLSSRRDTSIYSISADSVRLIIQTICYVCMHLIGNTAV